MVDGASPKRRRKTTRKTKKAKGKKAAPPLQPVTREAAKEEILKAFNQLVRTKYHHTELVPIPEVRELVRVEFGPAAAAHDTFDSAARSLAEDGTIYLTAISDLRKATHEQLQQAIPGMGETIYYMEPVKGYNPDDRLRRGKRAGDPRYLRDLARAGGRNLASISTDPEALRVASSLGIEEAQIVTGHAPRPSITTLSNPINEPAKWWAGAGNDFGLEAGTELLADILEWLARRLGPGQWRTSMMDLGPEDYGPGFERILELWAKGRSAEDADARHAIHRKMDRAWTQSGLNALYEYERLEAGSEVAGVVAVRGLVRYLDWLNANEFVGALDEITKLYQAGDELPELEELLVEYVTRGSRPHNPPPVEFRRPKSRFKSAGAAKRSILKDHPSLTARDLRPAHTPKVWRYYTGCVGKVLPPDPPPPPPVEFSGRDREYVGPRDVDISEAYQLAWNPSNPPPREFRRSKARHKTAGSALKSIKQAHPELKPGDLRAAHTPERLALLHGDGSGGGAEACAPQEAHPGARADASPRTRARRREADPEPLLGGDPGAVGPERSPLRTRG